MRFTNCTIIIPVIRETDLFEKVVQRILSTCTHEDIKEIVVVVCEKTAKESLISIEAMKPLVENCNISYTIFWQKLPGIGGAIRDAMEIASGSHAIMICADYGVDPAQLQEFITLSKQYPNDIIMGSRYKIKRKRSKKYPLYKYVWNVLAQHGLRILYRSKISDFTAAYWMYPVKYFQSIRLTETKHPIALEQTLKYLRLGVTFHEIPFELIGGSESGFWETLGYLRPALKCRFMSEKSMIKPGVDMKIFEGKI